MSEIQETITEKAEGAVAAVKATVSAVENVATDAATDAKTKAEALRADTRALGDKTRRFALEIWSDVRALARGGYDYAVETLTELRGKVTFKRKTEAAEAEEATGEASSNAA